jgi:hypothetical protein
VLGRVRSSRFYGALVWAAFAATLLAAASQLAGLLGSADFAVSSGFLEYWAAGQLIKVGHNPYDFAELLRVQQGLGWSDSLPLIMWNPPWLLVWLYPLLWLDYAAAAVAWLGVNFLLILGVSSLLWAYFGDGRMRRLPIAWGASFAFAPALTTLGGGQVSGLLLLSLAGFLYFARRGWYFAAGAALAVCSIKPHVVFLFLLAVGWWILRERRWRTLAGGAAVIAVSCAVLWLLRPGWIADYRQALASPPLYWMTPTLGGLLRFIAGAEHTQLQYVPTVTTAAAAAVLVLVRRPALRWSAAAGPILLISVLTAAYGWTYDQLVLLIPYLQIVHWLVSDRAYSRANRVWIVAGLVAYSAGQLGLQAAHVNSFFAFWTVWVLGGTYMYAWRARRCGRQRDRPGDGRVQETGVAL